MLIEDNPGDTRLGKRRGRLSQRDSTPSPPGARRVISSTSAANARCTAPDLIRLDRQLPGMGGEEVPATLSDDPDHSDMPVIVLPGSRSEREIPPSCRGNANACSRKIPVRTNSKRRFVLSETPGSLQRDYRVRKTRSDQVVSPGEETHAGTRNHCVRREGLLR